MLLRRFRRFALTGACLLLLPLVSSGATMTFFGEDLGANGSLPVPNSTAAQAAFLAQIMNPVVEDFESIAAGTQFPINIAFGPDMAALTGTNIVGNTGIANGPIGGRFAISGSQYLNLGTADAVSFTLSFSTPQAAFGFYATDIGDVGGQLALRFDGGPMVVVPHTVDSPNGSALFFGYINTDAPFTTVQFDNTIGDDDAFGFDDFTIGRLSQVVPEPSSAAMVATAASFLVGLARLRRRTA